MPRAHLKRLAALLLLAFWFGAVGGLLQVSALTLQRMTGSITHRGAQFVWMTPVAEVLLLLLPTVVLFTLGFWSERVRRPRVALALFGFLSCCSLLLLPGRVSWWAATLLALGIAWEGSRRVERHAAQFARLVRVTSPVLLGIVLVLGAGVNVRAHLREQRLAAALPPARAGAPNIIFIIWDTVRAQSVSLYDSLLHTTPTLEALAPRGVVFENAIATAPWTLPSHMSMFSGRYTHEFGASWVAPLNVTFPTLAQVLAEQGYRTGGFVGNLAYADVEHGLSRGFATYRDHTLSLREILFNSTLIQKLGEPNTPLGQLIGPHHYLWHKDGNRINREFLRWAVQDPTRPFFAFLNFFDAHDPYVPPAEFAHATGAQPMRFRERLERFVAGKRSDQLSVAEGEQQQRSYEATIRYLDYLLADLLQEPELQQRLSNTVIVVASDHGEQFGEHGRYRHGDDLYLTTLHVPLLVIAPGRVPGNVRVREPVTLRDLPATLLELAQVRSGALPGTSLSRYWNPAGKSADARSPILSSTAEDLYGQRVSVSVIADERHFMHTSQCREHLFDLATDPDERRDLAKKPGAEGALLTLRTQLEQLPRCDAGHTPAVAVVQQSPR